MRLRKRKIPFVLINSPQKIDLCHCVSNDDMSGTYEATKLLIKQGHIEIGFIGHKIRGNIIQKRRIAGFEKAIQDSGLKLNKNYIIKVDYPSLENGKKAANIILEKNLKATAYIVIADILTIGMISALNQVGIKIPEDISLLGNGNIKLSSKDNFNISTMDDCLDEIADKAVTILLNDILTGISAPQKIVVPQKIILRNST